MTFTDHTAWIQRFYAIQGSFRFVPVFALQNGPQLRYAASIDIKAFYSRKFTITRNNGT